MTVSYPRPLVVLVLSLAALVASSYVTVDAIPRVVPAAVSVREDLVVIPTYPTGEPLKAPMFFAGRTYQGAKGPMYPYVLVDRLGDQPVNRTYRVLWLENAYLRIGVLPELGGRIWEGVDKTNGYPFFYKNNVVKPALIGMVGAWISGGVEWNIPHHHRASSFMPVDARTERNPDGSATIWVGELEYRHRMRWAVGLTLHPGRSVLDATVRLVNRTPVAHSFLYFANVAVHANDQYQVVFPPSTQFGVHHAKREFTRWPISTERYGGVDFKGVDVSWWKNHPTPTSIFAWNYEDDFLAGYDHGKQAGTMHVADHHTVPGKKFFEWGPGAEGRHWDGILTDADGPYLELMVGGYSDNQPDYTWIQPGETKVVEQTWYPIRNIGAPKQATREAAVNLEPAAAGAVRLAFNATGAWTGASVRLSAGERVILDRRVNIDPGSPFDEVVTVPAGTAHTDLVARLVAPDGRELVSYQPRARAEHAMPAPVVPPAAPRDVRTNEELFLAGLRLEQFYSPAAEPEPYYEEAVRRDPGDARAHVALARLLLKRGLYEQARAHAAHAVERVSHNYTSPQDGAAHYHLGVALAALGDDRRAEAALFKATWDPAWRSAGYTRLAEIAARRGSWQDALARSRDAVNADGRNTRALVVQAVAHLQRTEPVEAQAAVARALAVDPLDHWARHVERWARLAAQAEAARREGKGIAGSYLSLGAAPETTLETANDYATLGLVEQALGVLDDEPSPVDPSTEHAMLLYARADYAERLGRTADAARYAARAKTVSPAYVFPFRLEHAAMLRRAIARDPTDARAHYYLGNLLFDHQPDAAVDAWEQAARLEPGLAMVHRNLGWAAARRGGDLAPALAHYERAIAADASEPVFFYEYDRVAADANVDPSKRYALLDRHRATLAERDDALSRLAVLQVQLGKYDEALRTLASRRFAIWEGGGRFFVHDQYVDAHLLRGHRRAQAGDHRGALDDYRAALEYPPNLGVGKPERGGRAPEVEYFVGRALADLGDRAGAEAAWRRSVAEFLDEEKGEQPEWRSAHYFQARAFEALGDRARATRIFEALVRTGEARLRGDAGVDFFAKFNDRTSARRAQAEAQYLVGLGTLGLKGSAAARPAFERALALDANHLGASTMLAARR